VEARKIDAEGNAQSLRAARTGSKELRFLIQGLRNRPNDRGHRIGLAGCLALLIVLETFDDLHDLNSLPWDAAPGLSGRGEEPGK